MSAKQPTKAQVLNAAHILENFAKKGMVGYSQTMTGGKKPKRGGKAKSSSKAKPKPKAKAKKPTKTSKRK